MLRHLTGLDERLYREIRKWARLNQLGLAPVSSHPYWRAAGLDTAEDAETMVGLFRLDNLHYCTATVLAQAIVREGMRNVAAGANAMLLKRGIDLATDALIEQIQSIATPVKGKDEIAQVATISAADPEIGSLIAEVMDKVGKDGVITVEESRGIKFETFAERRVRGAMIDALRRDAWPRGVRRQRRELVEQFSIPIRSGRAWPAATPSNASSAGAVVTTRSGRPYSLAMGALRRRAAHGCDIRRHLAAEDHGQRVPLVEIQGELGARGPRRVARLRVDDDQAIEEERVGRCRLGVLQGVRVQLGVQADPPALLPEVEQEAAGRGDALDGLAQLRSAVAALGAEDVAGQALAVDADEDVLLPLDVAFHERDVLLAGEGLDEERRVGRALADGDSR